MNREPRFREVPSGMRLRDRKLIEGQISCVIDKIKSGEWKSEFPVEELEETLNRFVKSNNQMAERMKK